MFNADKYAKAFENEVDKVIGDKIEELERRIKVLEEENKLLRKENETFTDILISMNYIV